MLFPVLLPEPPSRLPGTRFAQSQIGVACGIRRVRSSLARRVFWLWRARTRGSLPGPCSPLPRLVRSERPWDRTARAYLGGFPPPSPPLDLPCPAGSTLWCPRFGSVATPSCSSSLLRHSVFSVQCSIFGIRSAKPTGRPTIPGGESKLHSWPTVHFSSRGTRLPRRRRCDPTKRRRTVSVLCPAYESEPDNPGRQFCARFACDCSSGG